MLRPLFAAIANYQRNLAPLRQQVADANVRVNLVATQAERLPLSQKRETITRAQAIYERTLAAYERLAQYQSQGAISQERVEQAEKEMTVANSDLNIARSDYDSLVATAKVTTEKQAAQTRSTQLQQQLTLAEQAGQLQQLQSQLQTARADYQQIETKLQQIQKNMPNGKPSAIASSQTPILEPTQIEITAPISGMAIEIPISLGDRVAAGSKLMSITNPKKLKIGVDVEAQQAALLKTGQRALVKVGTAIESQELVALVTNIAPPVDRSTQRIEVEFTNPKPTVLIGQNGTVYFPK